MIIKKNKSINEFDKRIENLKNGVNKNFKEAIKKKKQLN